MPTSTVRAGRSSFTGSAHEAHLPPTFCPALSVCRGAEMALGAPLRSPLLKPGLANLLAAALDPFDDDETRAALFDGSGIEGGGRATAEGYMGPWAISLRTPCAGLHAKLPFLGASRQTAFPARCAPRRGRPARPRSTGSFRFRGAMQMPKLKPITPLRPSSFSFFSFFFSAFRQSVRQALLVNAVVLHFRCVRRRC